MNDLCLLLCLGLGFGLSALGLPPLVGFLLAGFAAHAAGLRVSTELLDLAHSGVLILLFCVGLKLRLKSLLRWEIWGVGCLHLALVVSVIGLAFSSGMGLPGQTAFLLALAIAFSSTVVAAKMLEARRELQAFHGRTAIGILIVQDLAAVFALGFLGNRETSVWTLLLLLLPLLRPLLGALLSALGRDELLIVYGLVLSLVLGGHAFEKLGLSGELGALVLGALLANHARARELGHALSSIKEACLVAFFLSIGLEYGLPTWSDAPKIGFLLLLIPFKGVLFFALLLAFRLRARSALLTTLALASHSEFALIVGAAAARDGQLAPEWLTGLAIAVGTSFAIAAPLNRQAHELYARYEQRWKRFEQAKRHPDELPLSIGAATAIVMGMGRVGTGAYERLKTEGFKVVGLDSDLVKVAAHLEAGRRVVLGDSEDPGLWHQLTLDGVQVVLLATPDLEARRIGIRELRRANYQGQIATIAHFPEEEHELLDLGANRVFNFYQQAGVGFATTVIGELAPTVGALAASPEGNATLEREKLEPSGASSRQVDS